MVTETRQKGLWDARTALEKVIYDNAWYLDSGEFEQAAEQFGDGSLRVLRGGEAIVHLNGRVAILEFLRSAPSFDGHPGTHHLVTNLQIDVHSDLASATARSYVTVLQKAPGFPLQPIVTGRYHDRFLRTESGWRIADRTHEIWLLGDARNRVSSDPAGPAAGLAELVNQQPPTG